MYDVWSRYTALFHTHTHLQAVEALQKEAAAAGAFGSSTSRFVDSQQRSDLALPPGAGWRPVRVKFTRWVPHMDVAGCIIYGC